jgi:hypothetical protein
MEHKNNDEHSRIQKACVKWYRYQYSDKKNLLFSITNGIPIADKGIRTKIYNRLIAEGLQPGVPDLFLSIGNSLYNGLYIEIKSKTDRLRKVQADIIRELESENYKCIIVRSLDEFMEVIKEYLSIR